ncbi:protein kinase domain-containing protein [Aeromonas veronii]|uniref:protein kinase domain-containing protein n=1 Tax=Aeromonas TaxID=642 RepID=UPI001C20F6CB|nr:protein kinase [Aeromonas sp. FDAARGOS 1416]QXB00426.1 protein kinase [Aeromonas sp. FDAARGOS 1416]
MEINIFNEVEALYPVFKGVVIKTFEGNSGKVYLVKNVPQNGALFVYPEFIAYKKCKSIKPDSFPIFLEEIDKWSKIKSRFIVPIQYVHKINDEVYVCMRSATDGTLSDLIKKGVDTISAFNYSIQIVKGLLDMRSSGLMYHQDLNPPNILFEDLAYKFDSQGKPRFFKDNYEPFPPKNLHDSFRYRMMISDFGMADYYVKDSVKGRRGGKFAFRAPEQYENSNEAEFFEPDLFALGVILSLLFDGKHPTGKTVTFALSRSPSYNKSGGWSGWAQTGERKVDCENRRVRDLILSLLSVCPKNRPSLNYCYDVLFDEFSKVDPFMAAYLQRSIAEYEDSYNQSKQGKLTVEETKIQQVVQEGFATRGNFTMR